MVVGERLGNEPGDPVTTGGNGQLLEEGGGDAGSLVVVSGDEGDLGAWAVGEAVVAPDADDLRADDRDQCLAVVVVDVCEPLDLGGAEMGVDGEEPRPLGLGRQPLVEADERGGVGRDDGSDVETGASRRPLPGRVDEEIEELADGAFTTDPVAQWKVVLDLVPVASPFSLLDDVAGVGEIDHDPVGVPLGHAEGIGDVTQTCVGLGGDVQDRPGVVGEEAPVAHTRILYRQFQNPITSFCLLVSSN